MKKHLIIFARSPFGPPVKTRLAEGLGVRAARGVYARLLYQTLFRLLEDQPEDVHITLSLASRRGVAFFKDAFPEMNVVHQADGDLGDRMNTALRMAFDGGAQQAAVIGSDLPEMDWQLIQSAFAQSDSETLALGPSADGGFYLICTSQFKPEILNGIPWSTEDVLPKLLGNLQTLGLKHYLLPVCRDIDYKADWQAWQDTSRKQRQRH
jgi:hypothetical protein